MTWIKICGVRSAEEARFAFHAGASAVGLMFAPESRRCLSLAEAAGIAAALGKREKNQSLVGVFVNASRDMVHRYQQACGLDLIQLHGEEDQSFCDSLGLPFLRVFRIRDRASLAGPRGLSSDRPVLLDAWSPSHRGGVGQTFSWDLAREFADEGRKFYLAGGLNPANVKEAVRVSGAAGVDVSSGVETDGHKDSAKIMAFCKAVLPD